MTNEEIKQGEKLEKIRNNKHNKHNISTNKNEITQISNPIIWLKDLSYLKAELQELLSCLNQIGSSLMIEKDLLKKLDMVDTKGIWKLNQAKEYLDLIMVQASLGIR